MKTYLEPAEIKSLEQAGGCLRDQLLIRILFRLGCRVSEAISLSVDDVDLEKGTVCIQHLKVRLQLSCPECSTRLGRKHTFCPHCGERVDTAVAKEMEHRRQRLLPIDAETLTMIKEFIRRKGPVDSDGRKLLFGINRHRAWQIIRQNAERAGLPRLVNPETGRIHNVSPHRLRDAFAVHAVKMDDSGDGLRLLQEHLGHASFNTTAKYRKISGEEHEAWYARLWHKDGS